MIQSLPGRRALWLLAAVLVLSPLLAGPALAADAPLTNADVLAMLEAGLGDAVVVAKIQQARKVDFALDTDNLVELSARGVPDSVMTAMLDRSSVPSAPPPGAGSGDPAGGTTMIGTPMGPMMMPGANAGPGAVWLEADGEELPLSGIAGEVSVTGVFVARFTFLNFVGLDSRIRIREKQPRIFITSRDNPTGRYYIVILDRDKDDNVRSVKMGRTGMFSGSMASSPDPDWTAPFEVTQESDGLWSLRPIQELKAGEYGLLVRASHELYDFAVEG